jgi:hypothetical protein
LTFDGSNRDPRAPQTDKCVAARINTPARKLRTLLLSESFTELENAHPALLAG